MYISPASDQIPTELIQAEGETLRSAIYKHIKSTWNKEALPDQWKISIIVLEAYHCYQLHTKYYPISFSQV
jgi:hypothetical protein